jgi:hypothetical protein
MPNSTAISIVQAQLDAYNAKDIEALLQTYAPDAQHFALYGDLLPARAGKDVAGLLMLLF